MYSTDVHPDGTRFATAGGDGTVKVWSMSCLFGGKFSQEDGIVNCSTKMKAVVASSKFLRGGNYVSSNTEDNDENSSSSEEREGRLSYMVEQGRQLPPENPQVGVNDLSGLIRRKNGCKISAGGCEGGSGVRCQPLSSPVSTVANASYSFTAPKSNEGALSPLSRFTQNAGATAATATATTPFFNKINHDILTTIMRTSFILPLATTKRIITSSSAQSRPMMDPYSHCVSLPAASTSRPLAMTHA
jgi:hypothetical protein